jgi:hypothetical protein
VSLADPAVGAGAGMPTDPSLPRASLDHLHRMTTPLGIWEHACYTTPRTEHGFCTDDNARALIMVCRRSPTDTATTRLATTYLHFLLASATSDGRFHNRRHADGRWLDRVGSDDAQGRALWALGVVSCLGPEPWMRGRSTEVLRAAARMFGSPHLRANAFAAIGASEFLADQHDGEVEALLRRTSSAITRAFRARSPWPETRLTYDNARLPEALLAAGVALHDDAMVAHGLDRLRWLVAIETRDTHFSFTPVGGWTEGERRPGFDQQPVEAAAMADACARAWRITGDRSWLHHTRRAARWFLGDNDLGRALYDPVTGGCADGLGEDHINRNNGAESTLAALSTLQTAMSS